MKPRKDIILVDGKKVVLPDSKSTFWIVVNKPRAVLTTMSDDKDRDTLLSIVPKVQNGCDAILYEVYASLHDVYFLNCALLSSFFFLLSSSFISGEGVASTPCWAVRQRHNGAYDTNQRERLDSPSDSSFFQTCEALRSRSAGDAQRGNGQRGVCRPATSW